LLLLLLLLLTSHPLLAGDTWGVGVFLLPSTLFVLSRLSSRG
jgi:hypothetical protein